MKKEADWRKRPMVKPLQSELLRVFPVRHGFSTRHGGVSVGDLAALNLSFDRGDDLNAVLINRTRFFTALGSDASSAVLCQQVHEDFVAVVDRRHSGKGTLAYHDGIPSTDGLVTSHENLPIGIFTADCLAALFYDPRRHVIGACHAGWMGSALGIVEKVVDILHSTFGSSVTDLLVAMGPSASWCCYEVDERVVRRLDVGGRSDDYLRAGENGRYYLDLRRYNTQRLVRIGVRREHIEHVGGCSICGDEYFSHRRQQGKAGRMLASIELLPRNLKD